MQTCQMLDTTALEPFLSHTSSSSTCKLVSPSRLPDILVAAAYISLPANPHGERLSLHITTQDENIQLLLDLK